VQRVVSMQNSDVIDTFSQPEVTVGADGSLHAGGHTVTGPLLVATDAVFVRFANAIEVEQAPLAELWRASGTPKLSLFAGGHYYDNWLALESYVRLWPTSGRPLHGILRFTLKRPAYTHAAPLHLWAPGFSLSINLKPGGRRTIYVPVSSDKPWTLRLKTSGGSFLEDNRAISVKSTPPRFFPTPAPRAKTHAPAAVPAHTA